MTDSSPLNAPLLDQSAESSNELQNINTVSSASQTTLTHNENSNSNTNANTNTNNRTPVNPLGSSHAAARITTLPAWLMPPHATVQHHPSNNNNNNGGDTNDEENLENQVNESYGMLSPFQGVLLLAATLYEVCFRVLGHVGVFQAYLGRFGGYTHFFLVTDVIRMVVCVAMETHQTTHHEQRGIFDSLRTNLVQHPRDALKMAVPVVLFWIQSQSIQKAAWGTSVLDLAIYGVHLGVAGWSILLLHYTYTRQQWICLVLIFVGCFIATWSDVNGTQNGSLGASLFFGLVSIAAGSLSLVFQEYVLKQDLRLLRADPPPASIWIRALQLSMFSALANIMGGGLTYSGDSALLNVWTWVFSPAWAIGSLLPLLVLKFVTALHFKLTVYVGLSVSWMVILWVLQDDLYLSHFLYLGIIFILVPTYFFGMGTPYEFYYQRAVQDEVSLVHETSESQRDRPIALSTELA